MTDINLEIRTALSDAFFYSSDDNDRFDEWFKDKLSDAGLFNWIMQDTPQGIPGVSALELFVNDFDDQHILDVSIRVDDGIHDFDELYDNDALLNYIEREVAPKAIQELNEICSSVTVPMVDGTFNDLKFGEDNEFYILVNYYNKKYFTSPYLKEEQFYIDDSFEVYV